MPSRHGDQRAGLTLPPSADVVLGVVGFVTVAGYIALAWLRRGRDPKVLDDASILMPAPPPAMTAATAAIVSGGGGRLAFIAALLDLATRDEIAFVAEGREHGADQLGIAFRGGETTDPQVRLNRRLPIGEAETWLLAELKAFRAIETSGAGAHGEDEPPPPEAIAAGMQMLTTMMRIGATTADDDDSFEARSAREHGLTATSMPDAAALEAAYEQRTGHAMPEPSRERIEQLTSTMSAFSDPSAIMKDPEAFAERMAAQNGHTLTDEERAQVRAWAATYATPHAAGGDQATASAEASYIPAARARSVQAPFLFGTLIQTYATRHGWMAELPLRARLHWYWIAIREAGVGAVLAIIGSAVRRRAPRLAGRRRPARRARDGAGGAVDGGPVAARRVDARPGRRLSTDPAGDDRPVELARRGEDGEPAEPGSRRRIRRCVVVDRARAAGRHRAPAGRPGHRGAGDRPVRARLVPARRGAGQPGADPGAAVAPAQPDDAAAMFAGRGDRQRHARS